MGFYRRQINNEMLIESDEGSRYIFRPGEVYTSDRTFIMYDPPGINKYTGKLLFSVISMEEEYIRFFLWFQFSSPEFSTMPIVRNSMKTFFKFFNTNDNLIVTHGFQERLTEYQFSYNVFFDLLNSMGERWDSYTYKAKKLTPIKPLNLIVTKDFFHKKRNLKGQSIVSTEGLFINKQEDGRGREEWTLCKFKEDIDGSSLDGTSSRKDHLFLPKSVVGILEEEVKVKQ